MEVSDKGRKGVAPDKRAKVCWRSVSSPSGERRRSNGGGGGWAEDEDGGGDGGKVETKASRKWG